MAFMKPALQPQMRGFARKAAISNDTGDNFVNPVGGHYNQVLGSVQGLNRKVWDDYYANYRSRENKAYDKAFNTDFVGQAVQRTTDALQGAQAGAQSAAGDMLSRYGQVQAGDQGASTAALTGLANTAQTLSARNKSKWQALDTRDDLQDNMIAEYQGRLASAIQNANNIGMEAASLKAAAIIEKAKKRSRRLGGLTAAIGVIAAPFTGGASLALTAGGMGAMR